jgi:integrase
VQVARTARLKRSTACVTRYVTLELLRANTDIHTLAKQIGNSAAAIERHYSKLTAAMAANRLA